MIGEPITFPIVEDFPDPDAPILHGCLAIDFEFFLDEAPNDR
jgi:hypothetical protein